MKTPEEMAMEYIKDVETARNPSVTATAFPQMQRCFLAGYKAAQEHAHAALEEAEARIQELRDQLMEESGGRLRLFKDDADAKAALLEALQEAEGRREKIKDQVAGVSKVMPLPEPPKEEE
jgi:hypothetical protein